MKPARDRSVTSVMGNPPAANEADRPAVVAPAPLIYLPVFVLGTVGSRWLLPVPMPSGPVPRIVGGLLLVASFAILFWVLAEFRRSSTPFDATRPATALVETGPFRYSRNPGYVALTLFTIAVAVLGRAFWILVLLAPAIVVLHYGVIRPEERHLEAVFGERFRRYKAAVRPWL